MHLKTITALVLVLVLLLAAGACTASPATGNTETAADPSGGFAVVDMAGRTVHFEEAPERLLIIGSALRLYTYIAGTDRLVGVERAQQNLDSGRPYILANPELAELPIIGEGFPSDPDPELMAGVNPDVIIAGDIMEVAGLDQLQANLGVPVVITQNGVDPVFDETTYTALRLIGRVTGNAARVEALIDYMDQCQAELHALTRDIPQVDRPSIYVGGLSSRGIQGIDSTRGRSALMIAINADNVADALGEGHFFIDKEKLLEWDPDILVIDQNGLSVVLDDYRKNPAFYQALSAVQNGRVYGQLPYTSYYSNIETALADIYYIGSLLYPEIFQDIDPVAKADEIYTFMLGKPLYDEMAALFGGFGPITLGE